MIIDVLGILLGVLVVGAITVLTGYFVAQEFGFMAVDRARLRARANDGDVGARRALHVTDRTSFMLSGAQLGITVTGLLVGYVAEPMIGEGLGAVLGGSGAAVVIGTVVALLLATVVQMVFGELFPKNLAIARPEPVARALALSTTVYLRLFGWLIRIFDAASNLLLRALRIEPVHDVEHSATPRDLEAIIDESASTVTSTRSCRRCWTACWTSPIAPRARDDPPPARDVGRRRESIADLVGIMASGHSRLPVAGLWGR